MGSVRFSLKIDFSHEKIIFETWGKSLQLLHATIQCGLSFQKPPPGLNLLGLLLMEDSTVSTKKAVWVTALFTPIRSL